MTADAAMHVARSGNAALRIVQPVGILKCASAVGQVAPGYNACIEFGTPLHFLATINTMPVSKFRLSSKQNTSITAAANVLRMLGDAGVWRFVNK
jgi:hypothetical protein